MHKTGETSITPRPAFDYLQFAQTYVSIYRNTLRPLVRSNNDRRALVAGRQLAETGLHTIIDMVAKTDDLAANKTLDLAFVNASNQFHILIRLLKLTLHQQSTQAEEKLSDSVLISGSLNFPFSTTAAEQLITNFENTHERLFAFAIRVHAAWILVQKSAGLLGIDAATFTAQIIRREIRFPPELLQSGLAILNYFADVMGTKYPDMNVGVTIEQRTDKVVLLIDTPEGQRELVEQELTKYGMVVAGTLRPEEFLSQPLHVMRLEQKLELANLEAKQTRELLASERSQFSKRIVSLEEQTRFLRDILDQDRSSMIHVIDGMQELANQANTSTRIHLEKIVGLVETRKTTSDDQLLVAEIDALKVTDQSMFDRVYDFLLKGALQSATGNWLYAVLQNWPR